MEILEATIKQDLAPKVQALQFEGNYEECAEFAPGSQRVRPPGDRNILRLPNGQCLWGGDYIIKTPDGSISALKLDAFHEIYGYPKRAVNEPLPAHTPSSP